MTRIWTAEIMGGPCGACSGLKHNPGAGPGPGTHNAGTPFTNTRVADTVHCTFKHGDGFGPGSVNGHPATVYRFAVVATG